MKYTIVWNENKTEGIILSGEDMQQRAERFSEAYSLRGSGSIQDGLVPMQPTDEMIMAGVDAYHQSREVGYASHEMVSFIWQAMVQEMNK